MKFADLKASAEALTRLVEESTGRGLFSPVTLEEPSEPQDELHFFKLVAWSYALLVEAGPVVVKELSQLLRSTDPAGADIAAKGRRTVEVLRTALTHNLPGNSGRDEHTRRQAQIWFLKNGGEPRDWTACCRVLCAEVADTLGHLRQAWANAVSTEQDMSTAVPQLLQAVDQSWSVHLLDEIVNEVARDTGLSSFDGVSYRKTRQDAWRALMSHFTTREAAFAAARTVIRNELRQLFG